MAEPTPPSPWKFATTAVIVVVIGVVASITLGIGGVDKVTARWAGKADKQEAKWTGKVGKEAEQQEGKTDRNESDNATKTDRRIIKAAKTACCKKRIRFPPLVGIPVGWTDCDSDCMDDFIEGYVA